MSEKGVSFEMKPAGRYISRSMVEHPWCYSKMTVVEKSMIAEDNSKMMRIAMLDPHSRAELEWWNKRVKCANLLNCK